MKPIRGVCSSWHNTKILLVSGKTVPYSPALPGMPYHSGQPRLRVPESWFAGMPQNSRDKVSESTPGFFVEKALFLDKTHRAHSFSTSELLSVSVSPDGSPSCTREVLAVIMSLNRLCGASSPWLPVSPHFMKESLIRSVETWSHASLAHSVTIRCIGAFLSS